MQNLFVTRLEPSLVNQLFILSTFFLTLLYISITHGKKSQNIIISRWAASTFCLCMGLLLRTFFKSNSWIYSLFILKKKKRRKKVRRCTYSCISCKLIIRKSTKTNGKPTTCTFYIHPMEAYYHPISFCTSSKSKIVIKIKV